MFEEMSTESIKQFQTLVDSIALEFVKLTGGLEAIHILFPEVASSQDFRMLQQRLQQVYSTNGVPFSPAFREYSRMAQAEINKREKNER